MFDVKWIITQITIVFRQFVFCLIILFGFCNLSVADANCPSKNFLDVSNSPGAGANYPKPKLKAYCSDDVLYVESNNIPNYKFEQTTPNVLHAQKISFRIPLHPRKSLYMRKLPLLGTVGVAVNGLSIFGPNEAAVPILLYYGDPVYNRIMDRCMGHTAHMYHYHALVQSCLSSMPLSADRASPILGYALDGYPIYGAYGCMDKACKKIVQFKSSWEQIKSPKRNAWSAYKFVSKQDKHFLDKCNGRVGPDGKYRYHATFTFPYVMGCYRGVPMRQVVERGMKMSPGAKPTIGCGMRNNGEVYCQSK